MAVEIRQRRTEEGCGSAPAELVARYFTDVYTLCFRVLGRAHDAEDATQETFLELFRGRERMAGVASERAWVLTVARNTAVSLGRSRRGTPLRVEPALEAGPIGREADPARLEEALAALSEEERHLVQMRFLEGKGPAELGEATGKAPGAAATALCRALKRLRALYAAGERA